MVVFTVTFALPGDPARVLAGRRQNPATIAAVRARYHLDDPLPVQYLRWLGRLARGDLGESFASRRPVTAMLGEALPTSLTLAVAALVFEMTGALLVGVVAARRRGGVLDASALVLCTLGLALPLFVAGVVLQDLFGLRWPILPVTGNGHGVAGYVLPVVVLALPGWAMGARLARGQVLELAAAPYVRTARAKGIRESRVTARHVARNALGPMVTYAGLEFGALVGGAVVVERVFNLPGVGRAIAEAIGDRDNSFLLGVTIVLVAVYLLVDLLVDMALMLVDPRTRPA